MTNKEFLTKVSKMQKEFKKMHDYPLLVSVCPSGIEVMSDLFNQFERENLLEHISKKLDGAYWHYEAMTRDGVKIMAVDFVKTIEDKR